MDLASLTGPELIFPRLESATRAELLRDMAHRIVDLGNVDDAQTLFDRLLEREQLGSTGVGGGVAIPHCKMNGLADVVLAIGVTRQGIDFGAVDHGPVRLFFLVVSPTSSPAAHLQCLATISKWVKVTENVRHLLDLADPHEIYRMFQEVS